MRRWRIGLLLVLALANSVLLLPTPRAIATALTAPESPWTPVGAKTTAATGTATPLADGRVLVTGGFNLDGTGGVDAELFDPAAGTWAATAPLATARERHTATRLADGSVLVVGGFPAGTGNLAATNTLATAERYDPATGRWTPVAPAPSGHAEHTATLLADGTVLVLGGYGGDERYDPATDTWTPAGPGGRFRFDGHTATRLADGRVLVVGGRVATGDRRINYAPTALVDLYDPVARRFTPAAPLARARSGHVAAALLDDQVLVVGGGDYAQPERYDPAASIWRAAGTTPFAGANGVQTATPLADGAVLIIGLDCSVSPPCAPTAARYEVHSDRWQSLAPPPFPPRAAAPLPGGGALIVGQRAAATYGAAGGTCFAETTFCLRGRFLQYWQEHGGLARNGFSLTPERTELLEDGREYTVQYFERVRLEYHPENAPPYDVLLGQFGRQFFRERFGGNAYAHAQSVAPVAPQAGMTFFPETGHNVGPRFLAYWQANGGLAQFGLPLGEELTEEPRPDGPTWVQPTLVQYFERARFEYHPENQAPYDILLGQFGREASLWATSLAPPLAPFYLANPELRARLGPPTIPADPAPRIASGAGALLPFEHGLMLVGADSRIQVLCGTAEAGAAALDARNTLGFPDPWTPDRPVGGGPGPRPGTYVPPRGFGPIWDQPVFRDCLGYATSPDATPYVQTLQRFSRGGFLFSTPDGQAVYALFFEQRSPQDTGEFSPERATSRYQRYTVPR